MKTYTITYTKDGELVQQIRKAATAEAAIRKLAAQYGWNIAVHAKTEVNMLGNESCSIMCLEAKVGMITADLEA